MSANGLTYVPACLFYRVDYRNWNRGTQNLNEVWTSTRQLETLDASDNRNIWSLSAEAFKNTENLKYVNLSRCCEEIPDRGLFDGLQELTTLDLSGNSGRRLVFNELPKLEQLFLSDFRITELGLRNMPSLNEVDLLGCPVEKVHLENVPTSIIKAFLSSSAKSLIISNSLLGNISIQDSAHFASITFSNSVLEFLGLEKFDSLTNFHFFQNKVKRMILEDWPKNLMLDLSHSSIDDLVISRMEKLQQLDLSNADFQDVIIRNLTKLEQLNLSGAKMKQITLENLGALTMLDISYSEIDEMILRGWPGLEQLSLYHSSLSNLKTVNISSTTVKILDLTEYSGNIEWIDVSNSEIDELVIRNMTSLKGVSFKGSSINLLIMDNPYSNITVRFSHSEVHELHLSDLQNLTELHFNDASVHELHIKGESMMKRYSLLPLEMKATALIMKRDESKEGNNASLSELIAGSPNLIRLDLSAFPIAIVRLRNNDSIQTLDLFDAAENILTLPDVTMYPPIKNVPWNLNGNELNSFFELKSLNMTECCVSIPEDAQFFRNLLNLVSLDVSYNSWKNPDESALFSLENLVHLDMSNTGSRFQWSKFFIRLASLETLNVNNMDPATIFQLGGPSFSSSKLRSLSVIANKFSGFDKSGNPFGLKSPENLEELDMSGAEIIGEEVSNC